MSSLLVEMNDRAMKLGVPLSVHIDVTYRCNERCQHCYLDHDDLGEMTTVEIKTFSTSSPKPASSSWCLAAAKSSCAGTFSNGSSTRAT